MTIVYAFSEIGLEFEMFSAFHFSNFSSLSLNSLRYSWYICPLFFPDEPSEPALADFHQLEATSLDRDLISLTTATLDKSQEELAINEGVAKEIWLDFEDFCVCFQ